MMRNTLTYAGDKRLDQATLDRVSVNHRESIRARWPELADVEFESTWGGYPRLHPQRRQRVRRDRAGASRGTHHRRIADDPRHRRRTAAGGGHLRRTQRGAGPGSLGASRRLGTPGSVARASWRGAASGASNATSPASADDDRHQETIWRLFMASDIATVVIPATTRRRSVTAIHWIGYASVPGWRCTGTGRRRRGEDPAGARCRRDPLVTLGA